MREVIPIPVTDSLSQYRVRSFTGMDRNVHIYRNGHYAMALGALNVF